MSDAMLVTVELKGLNLERFKRAAAIVRARKPLARLTNQEVLLEGLRALAPEPTALLGPGDK